jgi:hypothetical protein
MPITRVFGYSDRWWHRGSGYSTGPTETRVHNIIPAFVTLHTGLSQVQATTSGPLGAATGIMRFGDRDFGPDPANWPAIMSGRVGSFTVATQVTKGDMTVWRYFHIWE